MNVLEFLWKSWEIVSSINISLWWYVALVTLNISARNCQAWWCSITLLWTLRWRLGTGSLSWCANALPTQRFRWNIFVQTRHFWYFWYFSLALNEVNDEVLIWGIGFSKSCFHLFVIGSLRKQLIAGAGKPRRDWTWRRWIWLHWNQLTWMLRTEASWFFQHFLTFETTISFNSQHGINALVHLMGSVVK